MGGVQADYVVESLRSAESLDGIAAALEGLSARAIEDSLYLHPAFLVPLIREHADRDSLRIAIVRHAPTRTIVGVAPFTLTEATRRVPLRALSTFISPHSRQLQPLFDRDHARGALSALWDWIEDSEQPWYLALLENVSERSPFWKLLRDEAERRRVPLLLRETYERPIMRRAESFDAYLASLPSSRRKGWRRHLRDLERVGKVAFRLHTDFSLASDLAARFMRVEASSWKGASGTSLAATARDRAFFTECVAQFAQRRALRIVELLLDDRTIAMSTNFVIGSTLFAFKIGYDPAFSEHSPGILVEMEGIRRFHEEPNLTLADSGSGSGSYIRAYYRETVKHHWVWMPTRRRGRALVQGLPLALSVRDAIREHWNRT